MIRHARCWRAARGTTGRIARAALMIRVSRADSERDRSVARARHTPRLDAGKTHSPEVGRRCLHSGDDLPNSRHPWSCRISSRSGAALRRHQEANELDEGQLARHLDITVERLGWLRMRTRPNPDSPTFPAEVHRLALSFGCHPETLLVIFVAQLPVLPLQKYLAASRVMGGGRRTLAPALHPRRRARGVPEFWR